MMKELTKICATPAEIEILFGIPKGTLANLRWAKRGPKYHKIGRKVLYNIADFQSWINENTYPCLTIDTYENN